MRTRKGLDWTEKFAAVAQCRQRPAGLHHRRRGRVRSITTARRISAALQAALSEGRSQDLTISCSTCCSKERRTCAACP